MFMQELLYFITTAEHRNFTSAANQLFITQSGLSKNINKIEQELGVQLFKRDHHHHNVQLTAAGEQFLSSARTFLVECNTLKLFAKSVQGQLQGSVSVGVPSHYGHYGHQYVSQFLQKLEDELEQLELSIFSLSIAQLQEGLVQQTLDFVLCVDSVIPKIHNCESCLMLPRRWQVLLSSRHPLASLEKIKISQLKDEVFVVVNREVSPTAFDVVISLCNQAGFYPNIGKYVPDLDTLHILVGSGQMVSISCVTPDPSACRRVRAVPIDVSELHDAGLNSLDWSLFAAWRQDSKNPLVVQIVDRFSAPSPKEFSLLPAIQ